MTTLTLTQLENIEDQIKTLICDDLYLFFDLDLLRTSDFGTPSFKALVNNINSPFLALEEKQALNELKLLLSQLS